MGEKAEYIRNGVKWSVIENNLKTLSEAIKTHKNINIHIAPTVSIMNAHSLTDMHKYFVEHGYIQDSNAIILNILLGPSHYEMRNLPDTLKDEIKEKVKLHCEWLKENNTRNDIIENFYSIISYIDNDSDNSDILRFVSETKKIDARRNQDFEKTFPEYADWWKSIKNNIISSTSI